MPTTAAVKTALDGKADKLVNGDVAFTDRILIASNNGGIKNSGYTINNARLSGDVNLTVPSSNVVANALAGKADKAADGTDGELAALDGNGALIRSGFSVAKSVGEGSADKVPTTAAVKTALDGKADKAAAGTVGELAAFDGVGALKRSGFTVAQSVGTGSDRNVPTTAAVKNALDGKADKAPTGAVGELAAVDGNGALIRSGVSVTQGVGAGSNSMVPTTAAVKTALDGKADKLSGGGGGELVSATGGGEIQRSGLFVTQSIGNGAANMLPTTNAVRQHVLSMLDEALNGSDDGAPSLFVRQNTQTGKYQLVYEDSNDVLHVLFDFGLLPSGGTSNYNDLLNKPQIQANGQTSPLSGTLAFSSYEFLVNVVGTITNIQLKNNVFESYLSPTNDILYNFNLLGEQVQHSGVFKIRKVDVTNLPQEFSNAGQNLYVYHFMTNTTYSDLVRMVTYDTADGVKMWIQLVTLGGMDASGNVQVTAQTDWVELTGTPKKDISGAVVTLNQSVYIYDGTSKAPSVTSVVINGQTLIAGTDYMVIANPATNAGQYVVIVNGMGDYKGTVTTAWELAKAQATISGDNSITITGIDDPVTKTYTTDGDGAFSFAITGNIATVANIGGEVTITPTALGSTTMTVTLSEGANYLGATKTVPVEIVKPVTVFGVMWDYSLSSPQLARLTPQTDPLGVVTTVPSQEPTACVGNDGNGQSDFDNYMPWAGMQRYNYLNGQVVDFVDYSNGETFVYIPEFWSKIVDDSVNSKMYFYISDSELTGFAKHLGSGRYVSRYELGSDFKSVSGLNPKVSTALGDFRSGITTIDNNHFQYDFHTYNAIQLLYIVEFANLNSQAMIGAGYVRGGSVVSTGQTDSLIYHTGRISGINDTSAIQYRWIENLWGNVWSWVDGVLIDSGGFYICNNPTKYSSSITDDYTNIEALPLSSGWRKTIAAYNNCYMFPKTVDGSNSTYMCDYSYLRITNLCGVLVGGNVSYATQAYNGLFFFNGADSPDAINNTFGSRSILVIGGD